MCVHFRQEPYNLMALSSSFRKENLSLNPHSPLDVRYIYIYIKEKDKSNQQNSEILK